MLSLQVSVACFAHRWCKFGFLFDLFDCFAVEFWHFWVAVQFRATRQEIFVLFLCDVSQLSRTVPGTE